MLSSRTFQDENLRARTNENIKGAPAAGKPGLAPQRRALGDITNNGNKPQPLGNGKGPAAGPVKPTGLKPQQDNAPVKPMKSKAIASAPVAVTAAPKAKRVAGHNFDEDFELENVYGNSDMQRPYEGGLNLAAHAPALSRAQRHLTQQFADSMIPDSLPLVFDEGIIPSNSKNGGNNSSSSSTSSAPKDLDLDLADIDFGDLDF